MRLYKAVITDIPAEAKIGFWMRFILTFPETIQRSGGSIRGMRMSFSRAGP